MSEWRDEEYYRCPVCAGTVRTRIDTEEGRLYESESECTTCRLWDSEFSYGGHRERVGYCLFEWWYTDETPSAAIRAAVAEIQTVYRHRDFAAIREFAPLPIAADWFADNDCPLQEAAIRAAVPSSTLTESENG